MRFIRLEIKNLASLDNPEGEVIDFENGILGASEIFSIVGPTGSGKSTILDAICLPLYNRTPRYPRGRNERVRDYEIFGETAEDNDSSRNRISRLDGRNILSRGRKEGWSKLTFRANDGTLYRAEWSVTFGRVNYGKAQTALYRIASDGTETPCVWSDLPHIIGLDFNQFLRTVLIAQGSFAEFLNSEEKDRMILLERLIGAQDKFTPLAQGISDGKRKAAERLAEVEGRISAHVSELLSQADLKALEDEIERLEQEKRSLEEEKKRVEESIAWYETEKTLLRRMEEAEKGRCEAETILAGREADFKRLEAYDLTAKGRTLVMEADKNRKEMERLATERERLTNERARMKEEIENVEGLLATLRESLAEARARRETEVPKIRRALTLRNEEKNLRDNIAEEKKREKNLRSEREEVERKLAEVRVELGQLSERRNKAEEDLLRKSEEDARMEKRLAEALAVMRENLEAARHEAARHDDVKLHAERERCADERQSLEKMLRLSTEIASIEEETKEKELKRDKLKERIAGIIAELSAMKVTDAEEEFRILGETYALMTGEQWETQRARLKEGEPCPLCGSVEHPYAERKSFAPVADEMGALLERKRSALSELRKKEVGLRDRKSADEGELNAMLEQLDKDTKRIERLKRELPTEDSACPGPEERETELPAAIEALRKREKELGEELALSTRRRALVDEMAKETDAKSRELVLFSEKRTERKNVLEREIRSLQDALTEKKTVETGYVAELEEKGRMLADISGRIAALLLSADEKGKAVDAEIGSRDPDEYSRELDREVEKIEKEVDEKGGVRATGREALGRMEGNLEKTLTNIACADEDAARISQELHLFLRSIRDDTRLPVVVDEEFLRRLAGSDEDWEELRARLLTLRDNVTTARATLAAESASLERHREKRPESEPEELWARLEEIRSRDFTQLENMRVRRRAAMEARARIEEDAVERDNAAEELNDWKELQEAIGTDGMRVRKIAQCYTLGFLVDHANAEIRRFNSRYELVQVRNSLDIRVIDHELNDDIRDTTSLSGGETFIVSLGLALGLSSLSSRNVSFDNLFIDEGFGSLDGDTLSSVIESLSMLQSSRGKKVGVISHTDLMSERIPTQIRVVKQGSNGSSRITICS